jgi:hypothetical protein
MNRELETQHGRNTRADTMALADVVDELGRVERELHQRKLWAATLRARLVMETPPRGTWRLMGEKGCVFLGVTHTARVDYVTKRFTAPGCDQPTVIEGVPVVRVIPNALLD